MEKKPELTKEEELKEKFKYLRKLEDLERKGVPLSKRYNMESNLQEIMGEYELFVFSVTLFESALKSDTST